ncbi:MAG TPA: hypothetical protein DCE80_21610 [Ignavibacteriales bacterium]|nr:hypothetical protein [Ignavibacteriales bacterium]
MNLAALMNKENTGIRQKLIPIEVKVLTETNSKLKVWRKFGLNSIEVKQFYSWIDSTVLSEMKNEFNLE